MLVVALVATGALSIRFLCKDFLAAGIVFHRMDGRNGFPGEVDNSAWLPGAGANVEDFRLPSPTAASEVSRLSVITKGEPS